MSLWYTPTALLLLLFLLRLLLLLLLLLSCICLPSTPLAVPHSPLASLVGSPASTDTLNSPSLHSSISLSFSLYRYARLSLPSLILILVLFPVQIEFLEVRLSEVMAYADIPPSMRPALSEFDPVAMILGRGAHTPGPVPGTPRGGGIANIKAAQVSGLRVGLGLRR